MPAADAAFEAALPAIAAAHGTPCFVYSLGRVADRLAALRSVFEPPLEISFAIKSNPNPTLLRLFSGAAAEIDAVDGVDVSSGGELTLALECGWPAERIRFTGPAKSLDELRQAVEAGVQVIVESLGEARDLARIAVERGRLQGVLVRIAPRRIPPGFGVNLAGRPTQFGIDEEDLDALLPAIVALEGLSVRGFHIYSASQGLDAHAVADNLVLQIELFRRVAAASDLRPATLVFGAAFGVPYHAGDEPLDLAQVALRIRPELEALRSDPRCGGARLVLELGRYLVAEAGVYLTRVVRIKRSRGQDIAICDGGMNHHAAATGNLGSVLHRNFPLFRAGDGPGRAERTYDVVGPLCTTIDRLGHDVRLAELDVGDLIGVRSSGAYALTASPLHFIQHRFPREVLVRTDGVATDVTWLEAAGDREPPRGPRAG